MFTGNPSDFHLYYTEQLAKTGNITRIIMPALREIKKK